MKNKNLLMLVEAGVCLALAQILSYVKILELPAGGSVTAGALVPIFVFAARWGAKQGIIVGIVYGILQFVLGPKWSFHPVSLIFDYPVAFGALGVAGFFRKDIPRLVGGIFLGIFLRFVCHVISGVVVFASSVEGQDPLVYSIIYNGTYLIPEFVISALLAVTIVRHLGKLSEAKTR